MNKLKKFILLLVISILLYGCNKAEGTLSINSDKSVNFDIKILVNKDFNETPYLNNISTYKLRKIDIQRITEGNTSGYSISKKYGNIDDISTSDDITIDLSKYLNTDFDERVLFKVEKGYLSNKYYASFVVDNDTINKLLSESAMQTTEEFLKIVKDIYDNSLNDHKSSKEEKTYTSEKDELSIDKDVTYSITVNKSNVVTKLEASNSFYKFVVDSDKVTITDIVDSNVTKIIDSKNSANIDAKFTVKLPGKSLSNNADEVSTDEATLIWKYNKNRTNEIKFSFELENRMNYFTLIGIGLLIFVMFIILVYLAIKVNDRKRRKIEEQPIYQSEEVINNTIQEASVEETNQLPPQEEVVVEANESTQEANVEPVMEETPPANNIEEEQPNVINIE